MRLLALVALGVALGGLDSFVLDDGADEAIERSCITRARAAGGEALLRDPRGVCVPEWRRFDALGRRRGVGRAAGGCGVVCII